jgi:hypothetical protein
MFIRWLIFIHVLAVITFFLAHGTSAAMALKLRKETDLARIRAMLDLSASSLIAMGISFLVMGLTGLIMPFLLHIWDKVWIWLSIVLMVIVFLWMGLFNEKSYKILRKLVGLPYMQGNKEFPAEPPASVEEVVAHLKKINAAQLAIIGYALPAIVLWLMIFKPF